jgi:CRISPR-associated endonuclease/helicase Cas3
MIYYAHTATDDAGRPDPDTRRWQPLAEHLRQVARLARRFAEPLGLENEAELAGLLHDLGKYSERFQARLRDPAVRGINHWAAGAAHTAAARLTQVAFAIDGHHTGIPARDGDGIRQTIAKMLDEREREEFCRCRESVPELVERCRSDGIRFPEALPRKSEALPRKSGAVFAEALRTRMLFSCLVDADFLDTEAHFTPDAARQRLVPMLKASLAFKLLMDELGRFPTDGNLNQRRRNLLEDCIAAAEKPSGLFTLTAPTGSGKTLSSLAFALRHIEHHNSGLPEGDPRCFRRIVVVIPFTTVIEQTASVYQRLFENEFGPNYVLEHHSSVAPRERPQDRGQDAENQRLCRARLAAENWSSPIVITTSVQFFESLFSNRPSDCRKLHNLGRSVILFDEVQTLPPALIPSLLSGVKVLTRDFGVTAIFMTATQPAFTAAGNAVVDGWNPVPISTNEDGLAQALRRTRIFLPKSNEVTALSGVARQLSTHSQGLCVVNTTSEARRIFGLLREASVEGVFHLSSRLCPEHRKERLAIIRDRLAAGQACRLVSTQLIEAGVDLDFPIAFRAIGPLDSIIQTAGRCNREGRSPEPRPVIIFRPEELKTPPGAYRIATAKTIEFLARHPESSEQLHLPEFYAAYFRELYGLLGPESSKDDPVFAACEKLDFPKAAEECQLIGDVTRTVLVKWGRGSELADKLARQRHLTAAECREAQRYSVNLYQGEFLDSQSKGYLLQPADDWDYWVWNSDYDPDLGLGHVSADDYNL